MSDEKKKPEAPPAKPAKDKKAEHLAAVNRYGARLCPVCNGLGFNRSADHRTHIECKSCLGTGCMPKGEYEAEAFVPVAVVENGETVTTGWKYTPKMRHYAYVKPDTDRVFGLVTDAEIDATDGSLEALRGLVAEALAKPAR